MILHNLAPLVTSASLDSTPNLRLVPTSFPPAAPPPLPIAVSVTLERLASPVSTSKLLQKEVVSRLRNYFERVGAGRRVLKVGDLLGLAVDEGATDETEEEASSSTRCAADRLARTRTSLTDPAPGRSRGLSQPTTPVFFRVLHLRQPKSEPIAGTGSGSWETRALRGDFGCIVDPQETMIVQAGSGKGLGVGGPFVDWLGLGM